MKKESKLFEAAVTIASGMLTEVIYGAIYTSHYEKKVINKVETFIEIRTTPIYIEILIILLLFFILWFILLIVFPRIAYKIKSSLQQHKPTYNTKEIIEIFRTTKQVVQNISFVLNNDFSKISFSVLYSNDVANCINKLYGVFCSKNKTQQKTIKFIFHNSLSISTNGQFISKNEFIALVSVLEQLLTECKKTDSKTQSEYQLLETDINDLQKKSDDLKLV